MNEARAIRLFHAITQISDTLIEEASGEEFANDRMMLAK